MLVSINAAETACLIAINCLYGNLLYNIYRVLEQYALKV